jgi:hypothetical protein
MAAITDEGPRAFARFAYPPNSLGYCGPQDVTLLPELTSADAVAELRHAMVAFAGAWPYLELIGGCLDRDPLDPGVVEAYWLGNELLQGIDILSWGNSVEARFRSRAGWDWRRVVDAINAGGVPNHAFHVFCIYPWVGLLMTGRTDPALDVLDQCRIRWGRVRQVGNSTLVVESRPLAWDGRLLHLGAVRMETVDVPIDRGLPAPEIGDPVAMHWNYACQTLTPGQLRHLRRNHDRHLAIVNAGGVGRMS